MIINIRLSFVFVLFMFLFAKSEIQFEKYFYWRHFNGSIPEDAVPGGDTCTGDRTYIGSTFFTARLLPSTIYRNDRYAYSHYGGDEDKSDKFTKILCAEPCSRPIWKQVDLNNLPTDCYFIEGGSEDGYPLYIGRVNIKGIYHLGKVFPPTRPSENGLEVFTNKFIGRIHQFQILAYCPSEVPIDCDGSRIINIHDLHEPISL